MKFQFVAPETNDFSEWERCSKRLEDALMELSTGTPLEENVRIFLTELVCTLRPIQNQHGEPMLFLMYDDPAAMPPDARVDFVYRPTYFAAAILMTTMHRFPALWEDPSLRKSAYAVLTAAMGRNFMGSGYEEIDGLLDTLEIFAIGDSLRFIEAHPDFHPEFAKKLGDAIAFLETDICSGKQKNAWSGADYSERGNLILEKLRSGSTVDYRYVWYACYGSNINRERFMRYINACTDNTPPVEDRPFRFQHNIYFSKSAKIWNNGGKAFLDDTTEGNAYGRVYKITRAQYEEVKCKEGLDYKKRLYLGTIQGIPVYSFTDKQKNPELRMPSDEYFQTILKGLQECYTDVFTEREITEYLIRAIMPENAFRAARVIRENAHYLTNDQIVERTGMTLEETTGAVQWLLVHKVIQQDGRSIRANHQADDPQAYFYTVEGHCGRNLISAMINALPEVQEDAVGGEQEGRRYMVTASRIERSAHNRLEAIRLHGYICQVCGFDYAKTYGQLGKNYIEVHHINPLAEQEDAHIVDPRTDLACLCANCHRMIHRSRTQVLSVEELREIVESNR